MMDEQDAVWVAQARDGDDESFRRLVERHGRPLFRLAYRMTGNEHDAEDIVQETFLRVHRSLDRYQDRAGFATWLHRIAANCSIDLLRRRRRQPGALDPVDDTATHAMESLAAQAPEPDHAASHADLRNQVNSALGQLSDLERAAFVFRHFEHKSIDEIGTALGLRESAAKQAVFRAVQKMRRALEPLVNPAK
jgi:RNA polymerase sigma-70 factor (ECF subfamily)